VNHRRTDPDEVSPRSGLLTTLCQEITMRIATTPAVLLVLALVGCGADSPTAPVPDTPALDRASAAHRAAPERPMRGRCEASYAEPPVFEFPLLHIVSVGTCQFTHLGRTSQRTVQVLNVLTGVAVSQITFTAASGDLLYATSIGTGTPDGPLTNFTGVSTITGGSGRFADATGQMDVAGTVNTVTGDASLTYDGWIAY
jgi:hypothetical protein